MPQSSGRKTSSRRVRARAKRVNLLVRFDPAGKTLVKRAAAIRGLTVQEADTGVLRLPREAQIAFWQALQNAPPPTEAQRRLGALIRSVM